MQNNPRSSHYLRLVLWGKLVHFFFILSSFYPMCAFVSLPTFSLFLHCLFHLLVLLMCLSLLLFSISLTLKHFMFILFSYNLTQCNNMNIHYWLMLWSCLIIDTITQSKFILCGVICKSVAFTTGSASSKSM